jgi:integral membrane protein (TIGR01906 family)
MPLKALRITAKTIFIICIPLFLLSTSLAWGFNSLWLYKYGFEKYDVSQSTGLSAADLEKTAQGLIDYFKISSRDEFVHIILEDKNRSFELFTHEEQIHFKDVRQLVRLDYIICLITFLLITFYIIGGFILQKTKFRRQLAFDLIWGSGLSLALIAVMAIGSLLDFDRFFLQFHYLAFSNQYWSAAGYMLMLFPDGFWFDAALFCLGFMAGLAVLIGILAYLSLKMRPGSLKRHI